MKHVSIDAIAMAMADAAADTSDKLKAFVREQLAELRSALEAEVKSELEKIRAEIPEKEAPPEPPAIDDFVDRMMERSAFVKMMTPRDMEPKEVAFAMASDPGIREMLKGKDGEPGQDAKKVTAEEVVDGLLASEMFLKAITPKDVSPADVAKSLDVERLGNMIMSNPEHVQRLRGEPGKSVDKADLLADLLADEAFMLSLKAKDGEPGKDAEPEAVAKALLEDPEALALLKGEPGDSVDRNDVVAALLSDDAFLRAVKAKDGEPGKDAEPEEVARALLENEEAVALLKGEPGEPFGEKDLDELVVKLMAEEVFLRALQPAPVDIKVMAETIKSDEAFSRTLKGEPGDPGKAVTAEDAARALAADEDFIRRVAPAPLDPEAVAKTLKSDPAFMDMVKGEKGKDAQPPTLDQIADHLMSSRAFMAAAKGKDASPVDPRLVVAAIKTDAEMMARLRGRDGKDADAAKDGQDGKDGVGIMAPIWEPGVYRKGAVVTFAQGKFYRAAQDTAEQPGSCSDWERVGTAGTEFKGVRKDGVTYEIGDEVIDNGSLFRHDGRKFRMICQRGKSGEPGEDGADAPHITALAYVDDQLEVVLSNGKVLGCKAPPQPKQLVGNFLVDGDDLPETKAQVPGQLAINFKGQIVGMADENLDWIELGGDNG